MRCMNSAGSTTSNTLGNPNKQARKNSFLRAFFTVTLFNFRLTAFGFPL